MARSNNILNPNAREAMDRFKMEVAGEVGVNLKQGYNGDLTSRQAGSIGGQMVKLCAPVRPFEKKRPYRTASAHNRTVTYDLWVRI